MRPSQALDSKRSAVREAANRYRAANPRVFGSVLHGTDRDGSDLDLLVDALPGATLFDLGGLQDELQNPARRTGRPADPDRPAAQIPRQGVGRSAAGMSHDRLVDCLEHIRQAATEACSFVEGMHKEDFLADRRTQQAVIMDLVIIGEAATKIMDAHAVFAEVNPQVPWRSMRGMRNRIAHGYFDINLDAVWETVQTALPELLDRLPGSM